MALIHCFNENAFIAIPAVRQIIGDYRKSETGMHGFQSFTGLQTSFGFEIISGHTRELRSAEEQAEVLFKLLTKDTADKLGIPHLDIGTTRLDVLAYAKQPRVDMFFLVFVKAEVVTLI
ncbi:MAG: hypothetical protein LBM19_01730 [Holosporales bacterium]|jgi:hypothetical protein|nr:hypothetical protein [Holosporales bacterium]